MNEHSEPVDTERSIPDGFSIYPPAHSKLPDGLESALGPIYVHWSTTKPSAVGLRVDSQHLNAMGITHGAVYMMMLDFALANAVAYGRQLMGPSPTVNIDVDYMKSSTRGDWIYTTAESTRNTNTLGFSKGAVWCGQELLATGKGIFKLPKRKEDNYPYEQAVKFMRGN